jgi:preprotein translocase subunit YajC
VETYALIAEEAAPPALPGTDGQQKPQSDWSMFILLGLLFVVFYVLLIRPQQKKQKAEQQKQEDMRKNLTKSDHVVTIGGMHGVVAAVTDTDVVLKVDEKNDVRIRFRRDAISRVITEDGQGGEKKFSEKPEENK